jgi:hypothetical protein
MTKQHRRTFLTTVGLGSAALAGCIGSLDTDGDGNGDDNDNDDTTDPNGTDGSNGTPREVTAPAIAEGESIDDFEGIEWHPLYDHTTVEASDETLVGDGAMAVEADTTESIGAYRVFPDGLDVEGKDLSVAIKIESPLPARVVLEARARPERSADERPVDPQRVHRLVPHGGRLDGQARRAEPRKCPGASPLRPAPQRHQPYHPLPGRRPACD